MLAEVRRYIPLDRTNWHVAGAWLIPIRPQPPVAVLARPGASVIPGSPGGPMRISAVPARLYESLSAWWRAVVFLSAVGRSCLWDVTWLT
jgi:hypothetical protein